tara:strand:+ start:471 stop:911 length:441 start_codon:yes stop_codon:yes gene_type:complete
MIRRLLIAFLLGNTSAIASVNPGPMVRGCDFKVTKEKVQTTDVCLYNSQINMGQEWFSINPIRSDKVFIFFSNQIWAKESADGVVRGGDGRPVFHNATIKSNGKEIWSGTYEKFTKGLKAQCRIGSSGGETKYLLSNGSFICVWDK